MKRIVIIGAGYTGSRVAARAASEGFTVTSTRRSEGGAHLQWTTADPVDALDVDGADVVHTAPPDDWSEAALLEIAARARRVVVLSSASVYGNHSGQVVDEQSECRPTSPGGRARLDLERALTASGRDLHILRVVGIYGPGRTVDKYITSGRYKVVDGGEKLTNRIHVDDLVTVILGILDRAPIGPQTWLAADGRPVRVRELVDWLVEHRGITPPEEVSLEQLRAERGDDAAERWANSYTADNAKILGALGIELQHPTVIDGYRAIFAE